MRFEKITGIPAGDQFLSQGPVAWSSVSFLMDRAEEVRESTQCLMISLCSGIGHVY